MRRRGLGKLLAGIGLGVGLGVLFAPCSGDETRKKVKEKLDDVLSKVKDLDKDDVKMMIEEKINEVKEDLEDLDKEKVKKVALEKAEMIKTKLEELTALAKEKATPVVEKAVDELRESAINVTKDVLDRLENGKKEDKKKMKKTK